MPSSMPMGNYKLVAKSLRQNLTGYVGSVMTIYVVETLL